MLQDCEIPSTQLITKYFCRGYIKNDFFSKTILFYNFLRNVHRFGQAKFPDGGCIFYFRLEPIFNTTPAASKNTASFKSGQN